MGLLRMGSGVVRLAGARLGLLAALGVGVMAASGCRADRPAGVPRDAERVAGGTPRQSGKYSYTCKADGTVYVSDDWDNSLVYSGPVHAGDVVGIDVYAGRITVNGTAVFEHKMSHTDHLLFVERAGSVNE